MNSCLSCLGDIDITITLNLFAGLRDAAGSSSICIDVPPEATAAMAFSKASELYPALNEWTHTVAFARNEHILPRHTPLSEGDQLDVLPPVSGG